MESFCSGEDMKKLAVLLIVIVGGLLSGCVAYEVPSDRGAYRGDRDRDRDGVPNRQDRRPDYARRY